MIAIVGGAVLSGDVLAQGTQPATTATRPAGAASAVRDLPSQTPDELAGIGIDEHLNTPLPRDLEFVDQDGKKVKLGNYFQGHKPVILTLVYYSCPMLCGLVLNGQMAAMQELTWTPGQEYEVVTVSFDPSETPALARLKQQHYLKEFGRPSAVAGWHFLVGKQEQITALTRAVGFNYKWNDQQGQFAHAAVVMVATPQGKLSRYLYGVQFDPTTLRLSLVEASEGKIGSTVDKVLLYCFHYDPDRRGYALAAQNLMTAGGALMVLIVAAWLLPTWLKSARRRAATVPPGGDPKGSA